MTLYFDASVIVPFFAAEATSDLITDFVARERNIGVSTLAAGEFASALSRLRRMQLVTRDAAATALADCDDWLATVDRIVTDVDDLRTAVTFVRRFELGLRMPDAIHAATCLRLGLTLVTLDTRLARASGTLGIDVVVPA